MEQAGDICKINENFPLQDKFKGFVFDMNLYYIYNCNFF